MGGICTSIRSEEALEGDAVWDIRSSRVQISFAERERPQQALM